MALERQHDDLELSASESLTPASAAEQSVEAADSGSQESPESLQEKINQDIRRSERAPEILARIEQLAEISMPLESVVTAHPELAGIHITERFHVTSNNQLIFFTGDTAYLLPSATTFESGEGSIFPTDEDKKLFNGSITKVIESSKYTDSTPIIQHLAVYRYLNLNDPNRETALKAALQQAEKTLDSIAQTLKPAAPETEQTTSPETAAPATGAAPPGALTPSMPSPSMPSAPQPPATQGSSRAQSAAAA